MAEDQGKLVIRFESSRSSCAGAAAAFLLRRVAARAGSYAPGIQEHLFYEICQRHNGVSLEQVERWMRGQSRTLAALGYYVLSRRVAAKTDDIMTWVADGEGFRAAILATDGARLHGDKSVERIHAVGLTVHDATSGIEDDSVGTGLLMIDPWPGVTRFASPPSTLEAAHRVHKYAGLLLYWTGHA